MVRLVSLISLVLIALGVDVERLVAEWRDVHRLEDELARRLAYATRNLLHGFWDRYHLRHEGLAGEITNSIGDSGHGQTHVGRQRLTGRVVHRDDELGVLGRGLALADVQQQTRLERWGFRDVLLQRPFAVSITNHDSSLITCVTRKLKECLWDIIQCMTYFIAFEAICSPFLIL